MGKISFLFFFVSILWANAQINYVPAQVFVPAAAPNYGWRPNYTNINNGYPLINNSNNYYPNGYSNANGRGHLFLGRIGQLDKLLYNQEHFKDSRWWTSRDKIVEYPKDLPSGYVRHETISAIHVINYFYQGNHANATILKGGIGNNYVKIRLASTWGYGFKFLVQIFGH